MPGVDDRATRRLVTLPFKGIPALLAQWYIGVSEPYVGTIIERAGAKNVVSTKNLQFDLGEHARGVELLCVPIHAQWEI